jgi:transcriptional regulator with XRE-family HTH domain
MTSDPAVKGAPALAPAEGTRAGPHIAPAALRIALGAQLRRLREDSGTTANEAASALRATHSKISRLERGRTLPKQRDVADLLTFYGVTDETVRERMLALARQASIPGWWQQYSDVLPRWLELYVGLEEAASVIRAYEVQFVHGLMQTEDYARAVILIANADAPGKEIDRRVAARMRRQALLTRPDAPELWAVLDEAALRRAPDGPDVMRAQLEHLLVLADRPNVTLQVVPFHTGPHAAAGGPFTILRFPQADVPDGVYLEQFNSALYLDEPADVTTYLAIMNRLSVKADSPAASRDMLHALLRQG